MPDGLPDTAALLRDAATLGVSLAAPQAETILAFATLLLRWNQAFNLVSRRDQDRIYARHLLDSLSVAPLLEGARCLDLGTGAGLPGIPLAIARTDVHFTLIDRNERRIRFVRQATRVLGLENVEAICADARTLHGNREYDIVVSRAVAGLAAAWELARPALGPTGRLLLMTHGQQPGEGGAAAANDRIPGDARVVARPALAIPGLLQPHGLLVVERVEAVSHGDEGN